jgi:hypothetical protein
VDTEDVVDGMARAAVLAAIWHWIEALPSPCADKAKSHTPMKQNYHFAMSMMQGKLRIVGHRKG